VWWLFVPETTNDFVGWEEKQTAVAGRKKKKFYNRFASFGSSSDSLAFAKNVCILVPDYVLFVLRPFPFCPHPPDTFFWSSTPLGNHHHQETMSNEEVVRAEDSANFTMNSPIRRKFSLQENGEVRKVALLTGVTGQDGSYLSELLLEKVS